MLLLVGIAPLSGCPTAPESCDPAVPSVARIHGAVASTTGTLAIVSTWIDASCESVAEASVIDVIHGASTSRTILPGFPGLVLGLGNSGTLVTYASQTVSVVRSANGGYSTFSTSESLSSIGSATEGYAAVASDTDRRKILILSTSGELGTIELGAPAVAISRTGDGVVVALTTSSELVPIDAGALSAASPLPSCAGSFLVPYGPTSVLVGCGSAFQVTDIVAGASQLVPMPTQVVAAAGDDEATIGMVTTLGDGVRRTYPIVGAVAPAEAPRKTGELTSPIAIVYGDVGLFIIDQLLAATQWSTFTYIAIPERPNDYVDDAALARIAPDKGLVATINLDTLWLAVLDVPTLDVEASWILPSPIDD